MEASRAEFSDLLPHLGGLVVEEIECMPSAVVIRARYWPSGAACPACGTWSSRAHSGYARCLHDLPPGGRPVLIHLQMRRFLCQNADCKAVTFAGQVDRLTARYQRRSVPLARLLSHVALELAGRAGMRLAAELGIAVHRSTLLRLIIDMPDPDISAAPEVVGVDDFALRRGQVYATILIDAETGDRPGVLPGRTADAVEAWLRDHPGVQIICRDGSGAYAEAARRAVPGLDRAGHRGPQYRPALAGPYRDHLRARRAGDPAVPVLRLLAEVRELGYTGSMNLLYRYITQGRAGSDRPHLSSRRAARLLLTRPAALSDAQQALLSKLTAACPEMTSLSGLIRSFAALLRPHPGNDEKLQEWTHDAQAAGLPSVQAFTRGLRPGLAAATLPFHNGRTEGVNTEK